MKKIGIMGGTFDPPHKGHIYIAQEAYKKLHLDSVIFMPAGNPPHKTYKKITNEKDRYEMVKLAIADYEHFEVSDYEISKQTLSYTFLTLKYLKEEREKCELFFIAGADSLVTFESWRNIEEILNLATLVIFTRPGYPKDEVIKSKNVIEEKYNHSVILLDLIEQDISSSYIREALEEGKEVTEYLNSNVYEYIRVNGLYKATRNIFL
ncbi:nicotinate-nucleotide adenylyltransferase [Clostridium sp. 'White wine YQ']|uniref:nicotinate-nucleotide adenylyltransferase n=1 Tax=Clostridium sp. 'White wine YQ' TaxID=3027474 RepID=UPI0023662830|nr:nicotinate-nucleotide adenylyltransferase [Clostridium sp. 'White wine YQ']MDD7794867.1 nicotinate-nucleotide adenylyltransferase [Clostridium sp. 'White wine YQ']